MSQNSSNSNSYLDFQEKCKSLNLSKKSDQKDEIMFNEIQEKTKTWDKIMPKNPNKGGCGTGTRIVKPFHCSGTIRSRLSTYISNYCPLYYCCGSRGNNCCAEFNLSHFTLIPNASFFLASAFSSPAEFKQIISTKQFDCKLVINILINNELKSMAFWTKIFTDSVIVKACGTSQRTEMMTFAPTFKNKITDDIMMVISAKTGILGEGYANLVADPRLKKAPKRAIGAEAMLWIYENNVDDIEISFYRRNYNMDNVTIANIKVNLESENLIKNNRQNPMDLYQCNVYNNVNNMGGRPFQIDMNDINNINNGINLISPFPDINRIMDDNDINYEHDNSNSSFNFNESPVSVLPPLPLPPQPITHDQSNITVPILDQSNVYNNMTLNNNFSPQPMSLSLSSISDQGSVCNYMNNYNNNINNISPIPPLSISAMSNNNYSPNMVVHPFQFNMDDINDTNNNNSNINIGSLLPPQSIDDQSNSSYNSYSPFNFIESAASTSAIHYEVNERNCNYTGYGASRSHSHVARNSRYTPIGSRKLCLK